MCAHDLEGIVAKRLDDPYGPRVRWLKIKNRNYSQQQGRAIQWLVAAGRAVRHGPSDDTGG